MANRKVAVYKQVRVNGVWVKCPPYINPKNNKPENDKVLVGGKMEIHPEGDWGIFYYEGSKRKWKKVGPKYADAKRQADTKELLFRGQLAGLTVTEPSEKKGLRAAIDLFLEGIPGVKTKQLLSYDLHEFRDWVKKPFVEDLVPNDLVRFKQWIMTTPEKPRPNAPHRTEKLRSERTACNKVAEINQFYRACLGLRPGEGLIKVGEGRKFRSTVKRVQIYGDSELAAFFAACKPVQNLIFTVFLHSGLRKQELMHLEWADVNFERGEIHVTKKDKIAGKRDYSFTPKTHEEREVLVPLWVTERLKKHKETSTTELVFPTSGGRPNDKIWDMCRGIAGRAERLDVEDWFVHKFRATFASNCLHGGMDLVSVQQQLGHKDIDSTMRYLAALKKKEMRSKVDALGSQPKAKREEIAFDEEMAELDRALI